MSLSTMISPAVSMLATSIARMSCSYLVRNAVISPGAARYQVSATCTCSSIQLRMPLSKGLEMTASCSSPRFTITQPRRAASAGPSTSNAGVSAISVGPSRTG